MASHSHSLAPAHRRLVALNALLFLIFVCAPNFAHAATCGGTSANPQALDFALGGELKDLFVTGPCIASTAGTYRYGEVHILDGGVLQFADVAIDFWAKSILIQNNGSLIAGIQNFATANETIVPIGTSGGRLSIHLFGAEQADKRNGVGVPCKKEQVNKEGKTEFVSDEFCGVDTTIWNSNKAMNPASCSSSTLPGGFADCFYQYDTMPFDTKNKDAYFGYKVIGLSYGGTLRLYGKKGALYDTTVDPKSTGTSWLRLDSCPTGAETDPKFKCTDGVLQPNSTKIKVSASIAGSWQAGDELVITTTDYLSSHSEKVSIDSVDDTDPSGKSLIITPGLSFPHNAKVYSLSAISGKNPTDLTQVDTRAAVALLSRSIQVISGGKNFMDPLPAATDKNDDRFFGGHIVIRQGFKAAQIQGVDLELLGQGGKIGHYPIHFHMARQVPTDSPNPLAPTIPNGTFVKDCTVRDSMTRSYVLHATQGVLLARDVAYRTIGHSFYLEDGPETNNQLYANLAISALAAVNDTANDRKVPGLLAFDGTQFKDNEKGFPPPVPFRTDINTPTLFWSMNGWNDFRYNMAVGAETCGMCYWMVPGNTSGKSRMMNWTSYASEQNSLDHDGTTPIQTFVGNTCSSAMTSFSSIADVSPCNGTFTGSSRLTPIHNELLPKPFSNLNDETYYPIVHGGVRKATFCPGDSKADCSTVKICSDSSDAIGNCAVTTLDGYTSSFNYPETNFAALWFRPQWSLLINSAVTDVLNGGVSFVTGGGYTRSDTPRGLWNLARKDVFVGNTQTLAGSPFASNAGPVNPNSNLTCRNNIIDINYCIPQDANNKDLGPIFQRSNFATNQRFFNIYDGPSFQDSNAYLDIKTTPLVKADGKTSDCNLDAGSGDPIRCRHSSFQEGPILGVQGVFSALDKPPTACYLPNAAIAWKQPNGFYYPPAFHSDNLAFNNVDIRHFVIEPLFKPQSLDPDTRASKANYCNTEVSMWNGFTDVDRQTELNDDDGSLTGLINTISVNQDPFFNAPTEDVECKSDAATNPNGTAKTSPYDYVTAVVYPGECTTAAPKQEYCDNKGNWWKACTNERCFGIPLFRELLTPTESKSSPPSIRMSGQATGQRSTLMPNNGRYFIDTTNNEQIQRKKASNISLFETGKTYHVFLLFAKVDTKETFDIFVGKSADTNTVLNSVNLEKANISTQQITFTSGGAFPTPKWSKDYNPGNGILTVTMDMSIDSFSQDLINSIAGRCQPLSMCQWDSGSSQCKCNTASKSYLPGDCSANPTGICQWAVKDIDYPDAGAYGFSFTLPAEFSYTPTPPPNVACFTASNNPEWNVAFNPAKSDIAGDCFYKSAPPSPQFCSTP